MGVWNIEKVEVRVLGPGVIVGVVLNISLVTGVIGTGLKIFIGGPV